MTIQSYSKEELERLTAELEKAQSQIDSLQQKVHLCTAYDKMEKRIEQLEGALKEITNHPSADSLLGWSLQKIADKALQSTPDTDT